VILALGMLACTGGNAPAPTPVASRVDAVAAPPRTVNLEGFCDAEPRVAFAWPDLADAAPPRQRGWTWVNAWATWCKPCVAEMPMLAAWVAKFRAKGIDVSLQLLSVDAGQAEVDGFLATHPVARGTARIKSVDLVAPWVRSVGMEASSALPMHLWVDPAGVVVCGRSGALGEHDDDRVLALLSR
jgi:thiol-disulfide isomerase/thioredoxin